MGDFIGQLQQLLANPIFWIVLLSYYLIISAIGAMEMPTEKSSAFYRWAFRFLNRFAANLKRAAAASKIPTANGDAKVTPGA